jgi:hypothetical protein
VISNTDLKKCVPLFKAGWWESKTEEEKAWYLRFWASCR